MPTPKTFRPWQPPQSSLLPPSPSDWLSHDHQVNVLLDLVGDLVLSAILTPARTKDPRGEKRFDPRMVLTPFTAMKHDALLMDAAHDPGARWLQEPAGDRLRRMRPIGMQSWLPDKPAGTRRSHVHGGIA